jgi:ectoine hydroxylase-related dioxygenase (phytanoyl-CoA dioxygenase family)
MHGNTHSEEFAQLGYTVFPGVLAGEALSLLREQCAAFVAQEDARMSQAGVDSIGISHRGKRYFANECQRSAPALRRVLFSAAMADICRATLGDAAYFFLDQFVVKNSDKGLAFSWHQDSGYVVGNGGPADHAPYLTCWCPLDDINEENGGLQLIPGSHKDGLLHHHRNPNTNDLAVTPENEGIMVTAKAGDIVAFSSLTLHATGPNRSDTARRVYLAQYTPEAILDPGSKQLRRNAIAFLQHGKQVTFA